MGQWGKIKQRGKSVFISRPSHSLQFRSKCHSDGQHTHLVYLEQKRFESESVISQEFFFPAEKNNLYQVASVFYNRKEHYHGKTYDRMALGQDSSWEPAHSLKPLGIQRWEEPSSRVQPWPHDGDLVVPLQRTHLLSPRLCYTAELCL